MRVLTVGNMYPPHHFGGYEMVWEGAVGHLRERGHDVRVLTTNTDTGATEPDPPWVRRALHWHLRGGEFARLGLGDRIRLARHNHRELERCLSDLRPDVVAWWSMGGLTLTMLEAVRLARIPAVAFVHDEWLDYGRWVDAWSSLFRGSRRARLAPIGRLAGIPSTVDLEQAASYVFVSGATRRQAFEAGVEPVRTSVAHSGIDPAFLDPAPDREWAWRLLYVGRLDPRKGVDTAVEALAHLPEAARLEIVGGWDPGEERRLRALAARHGVEERVEFSGQRDRGQVFDAYGQADAVVFPVRWREPWGLVPLEAMARGRPVVATGRGGSGEYLRDGRNCLLFEADDARSLALALNRLADDPELRRRLREGGLETAPRYTQATFNEAVEAALLSASST